MIGWGALKVPMRAASVIAVGQQIRSEYKRPEHWWVNRHFSADIKVHEQNYRANIILRRDEVIVQGNLGLATLSDLSFESTSRTILGQWSFGPYSGEFVAKITDRGTIEGQCRMNGSERTAVIHAKSRESGSLIRI